MNHREICGNFFVLPITNTSFHEPSCEQENQSKWHVHEEDIVMENIGQALAWYKEDYGFPTLKGNMILEEVDALTILGSANKDVDSSMYWMDGCMKKLTSKEGNIFSCYDRRFFDALFSSHFDEKQQKCPCMTFYAFSIHDGTLRFPLI